MSRSPRSVRWLYLTGLMLLAMTCPVASGQEVGDTVVPLQSEDLRLGDRIVDRVTPNDRLRIESTTKDWLWVISPQGTSGWIARDAVQRVSATDSSVRSDRSPDSAHTLFLTGWLSVAHAHLLHEHLSVLATRIGTTDEVTESIGTRARTLARHCDETLAHLETLAAEPLPAADRAGIRSLLAVYTALRVEASALSRLTKDVTPDAQQMFREAQQSTKKLLVSLGAGEEAAASQESPP